MSTLGGDMSRCTMCERLAVVVGELVRVAEALADLDGDEAPPPRPGTSRPCFFSVLDDGLEVAPSTYSMTMK